MSQRRLRILLSAFACMPGRGSEPGVGWNAALALARNHDVWVLTQDEGRDAIEHSLRNEPVDGLTVTFFDVPGPLYRRKLDERFVQFYNPLWQRAVLPVAERLHEQVGFDVVHHVTLGKYWQASHLWKLGLPFVLGPVGGGESAPSAFRRGFGPVGAAYEACRDVARLHGERSRDVRDMVNNADLCLTATRETAGRFSALGADPVIAPGQTALSDDDLAHFDSLGSSVPDTPRFVAASRLLHWKGLHLAIAALARCDVPYARLDIIGDGPDRRRLEGLAEKWGVASAVTFHGQLDRSESLRIVAGSTALIHPALHDFSPTVVFEAMGLGKPVVALDLNGPSMQVTSRSGILVNAPNPEDATNGLARAMSTLGSDAALCCRLGREGRRLVEERYTWRRKAEFFDSVYERVLGSAAVREMHRVPA